METRSLLERVASGEITEGQADEIHETRMSRLEIDSIVTRTRHSEQEITRFRGKKDTGIIAL